MRIEKGSPEADPGEGGSARAGRLVRPAVLLLWVLSAVVAGSVVWWAVAAIGGEQGGARGRVYTQAQVAELVVPSADPGAVSTPSGTPSATSPSSSPVPAPSPSPVRTPAPAPIEVARTWDVVGGQVGAQCRDAQIALLYATPLDGWTVEVKHGGPEELEVTFRQGESETSVHGTCVAGVPSMVAEAESD